MTTIDIFTRILLGAFIDKLHTLVVVRVECDSVSLVHKSGTLCRLVNVAIVSWGRVKLHQTAVKMSISDSIVRDLNLMRVFCNSKVNHRRLL